MNQQQGKTEAQSTRGKKKKEKKRKEEKKKEVASIMNAIAKQEGVGFAG